jgi:hypothetical protein
VTPFALHPAAQFRPDGPVAHVDEGGRPNRAYVRQARDVLRDSRQLDDRTKSIAAYWWDGPSTELPPGHWCLLAQYVSRRDRSGHSTFSAAAAEVLASFTGSRRFGLSVTIPAGSSMIEPGVPSRPVTLTFPTFDDAADQAGRSCRYGGIHFEAGDLDGRRLGRRVGANAWAKASGYFDGTAAP